MWFINLGRSQTAVPGPQTQFRFLSVDGGGGFVLRDSASRFLSRRKKRKERREERKKERKKGKKKETKKKKRKKRLGFDERIPTNFYFSIRMCFYGLAQRTKLGHSIRFNGIGHGIAAGSGKHKRENRRGGRGGERQRGGEIEGGTESVGREGRHTERETDRHRETERERQRQTARQRQTETER